MIHWLIVTRWMHRAPANSFTMRSTAATDLSTGQFFSTSLVPRLMTTCSGFDVASSIAYGSISSTR